LQRNYKYHKLFWTEIGNLINYILYIESVRYNVVDFGEFLKSFFALKFNM